MADAAAVPVFFYLPCAEDDFRALPRALPDYLGWQERCAGSSAFQGRFHWVLQTYLQLRASGAPVRLVRELPERGIAISHVECFDYAMRPTPRLMLVSLQVDKEVPLPWAAFHVTHNPVQKLPLGLAQDYLPPWVQIGLVPRDKSRGLRFENVAFVGYPENLHPALATDEFAARLGQIGLRLVIPLPSVWHDFSEIDAVMAVRSFGRTEKHLNKPALKLYNAWAAGVPAILGYESAYRREGSPGVDYLEATDEAEIFQALQRLASDPALRVKIVAAGSQRGRARDDVALRTLWQGLIRDRLIPLYRRWTQDRMYRGVFSLKGAVRERLLWRRPAWFGEVT